MGYLAKYPWDILKEKSFMGHAIADKQKLLNRVRRLRGQIDAIERALDSETGCSEVMRLLSAARGAVNGIMAEVVEDHIHMHMIDEGRKPSQAEAEAAEELVGVLRSYIR
jgi:DNA-binding FrmR family transcriptional regulator